MKNIFLRLLAIILTLGPALSASAHAFLDHAVPPVGAVVVQPPAEVKIWFTEELEPAFSVIEVRNAAGVQVDGKDVRVDSKNGTLLSVSLPPLPPGTYKVSWHVVAKDTHHTQGGFPFTIKK